MATNRGRFTAEMDGDFVVLLIGMRFTKPWLVHKWVPIARAFKAMQRVLDEHPELGRLGHHDWVGRTTLSVQYWRDVESLNRFASDTSLPHAAAWRRFNRAVGSSGDVGVWHETYRVRAGDYETIYTNMPAFGLAGAGRMLPIGAGRETAAERMGSLRSP